jgi:hypothetical protein
LFWNKERKIAVEEGGIGANNYLLFPPQPAIQHTPVAQTFSAA